MDFRAVRFVALPVRDPALCVAGQEVPLTEPSLALAERSGLPDALRVLLEQYPREGWEVHPHFTGMVQFWLERHMMFRKLHEMLSTDAEAAFDRKIDIDAYAPRLSRFGGMMLNELHTHHHVEDSHYFPTLSAMDKRLAQGFEILDKDHHALDGILHRFADGANDVLRHAEGGAHDEIGRFRDGLTEFGRFLGRHLEDEEEIVVPIILHHGPGAFS